MSHDANLPDSSESAPAHTAADREGAGRIRAIASELLMVVVWTIAADLFVFRGRGYFALAAFFAVALVAAVVVHRLRERRLDGEVGSGIEGAASIEDAASTEDAGGRAELVARSDSESAGWVAALLAGALLVVAILRLGWEGSVPLTLATVVIFVALVLTLSGWLPTLLRTLTTLVFAAFLGAERLPQLRSVSMARRLASTRPLWLSVLLPAAAVLLFSGIFVLANPDLVDWVSNWAGDSLERFFNFFSQVSVWELPFCVLAFLVGAGLLRPLVPGADDLVKRLVGGPPSDVADVGAVTTGEVKSPLYAPFRNMLVALIGLFAAYLVFEFSTLWRREFPAGFYYAGYAHEGAAWLTVALALATFTLSLVFHEAMFRDPRIERLRMLAWIWSGMNLLLAMAVYNRLFIYVGYNGLTRMRTVGFFGITLVLVGFGLVIFKIVRRRSLSWLIQSQLIALSLAIVLYCLFPVDYVAHRYNASQVAGDYLPPAVMIAVKPIDDEGVFPLLDLVDHPDEIIRDGVRAMLAKRQRQIESYATSTPWSWHRYQYSKTLLYRRLKEEESKWREYRQDPASGEIAMGRFRDYAMQWY
ncbi:DUF4153 domain-containing protein [Allorhodopirellula solitaria]|uniref:Uncharacterized protein n=1 Tax=Allorhodopirellula solitaria TaxID=2527987 RepID=A0A5C5XNT8_9BACT|nr:DUF4153 domain-containing protein [Allorhodopirellula solitaria]TWT64620.1 hypothetical protein CA85_37530 [Allorhodopirellula solitaria]